MKGRERAIVFENKTERIIIGINLSDIVFEYRKALLFVFPR